MRVTVVLLTAFGLLSRAEAFSPRGRTSAFAANSLRGKLEAASSPPPIAPVKSKRSIETLHESDLKGKRVLVRCDLNVPLKSDATAKKEIADDTRIKASLATIKYLRDNGAKILLASHLGRPKRGPEAKFSLSPVAERLTELLSIKVQMCEDCIGDEVSKKVSAMQDGDVLLLENVRFHPEEEKNEPDFAQALASNADMFVNDAFGTAHRAHASTAGVTEFLRPSVAGFLLQNELTYLQDAVAQPTRPFAAIIGGSKVSTKIGVIEALLDKVDKLVIGGGMVYTFLKSRGINVGNSIVEDDKLELARKLEALAASKNVELLLPTDVMIGNKYSADAESRIVPVTEIPDGWMGLDAGPETTKATQAALQDCKTVIWNGPVGVFEFEKFSKGTRSIAHTLAEITQRGATTIIGGGDSVAAVEQMGLGHSMSHISTGGGAALEMLEGKTLPGVAALDDA